MPDHARPRVAFWYSTLSAVTELGVTAVVYTFIFTAYRRDVFRVGLIAFALTYEVLVNISYMTFRLFQTADGVEHSAAMTRFLAFHGILSLVMFLGLVAFTIAAVREHKRGLNLFRQNPAMMWAFVFLWAVSILTGEAIYVLTYL